MKPKPTFHPLQLALLGIPFLVLNPAAHAQDQGSEEEAVELAETKAKQEKEPEITETEREKENARREEEAAERAEEAAETNGAEEAKENAGSEEEASKRTNEADDTPEITEAEREKGNDRREEEAAERAEEAAETNGAEEAKKDAGGAEDAAERTEKDANETKEPAADPKPEDEETAPPGKAPEAGPQPPVEQPESADEKPDTPAQDRGRGNTDPGATGRTERRPAPEPGEGRDPGERSRTPAKTPEPRADESNKPLEDIRPRGDDTEPAEDDAAELVPEAPAQGENAEVPTTEPERRAESEVAEATREVSRELDQRKTRIEDPDEARAVIDEIIGAESRISRAEIAREERFRPRFERQRESRAEERRAEVSPDQRRAASTYFQQRLRGREFDGPPPEFFGRSRHRGDRWAPRVEDRVVERVEFDRPRYFNEGRRYVHYDTRSAIPAILMAAQAMNHVRFQPTREIAPMFHERRDVSAPRAMPLPPEDYRGENSWVVSYPVDENSMISSEDILFLQGSTQFSDPYSYEVVGALADAMKEMSEEERFVIEGHASAEGSYDDNMALSQQRAEYIVREIVRHGVSPYRLLPVGYGESEARHRADADEALRSRDRRVVVFRMKSEPIAAR